MAESVVRVPLAGPPPWLLFMGSGTTQYAGAALAVSLFAELPAASVGWARLTLAACVLMLVARPWRQAWSWSELGWTAVFGLFIGGMNVCFYLAIARLPLGTAVAIEFMGPVAVATLAGSGLRERFGALLAASGVVLLAGLTLSAVPEAGLGLLAITGAAAAWAGYIVLGRRISRRPGLGALALAMSAGALMLGPFFAAGAAPALGEPRLMGLLLGVALLSSVVPYGIEQHILRRVSAARFSVLLALLPATAALVGALGLGQVPSPTELVGLLLVSVAVVLVA